MAKEISEPRWPWLVFGDGHMAQLIKIQDGIKNEAGENMIQVEIRPTEELIDTYHIDDSDFVDNPTVGQTLIRQYPAYLHMVLSTDPVVAFHVIECSFEQSLNTPLIRRNESLLETIRDQNKLNSVLRAEKARLIEEIRRMKVELGTSDKETAERYENIIKKLRGRGEREEDLKPGYEKT